MEKYLPFVIRFKETPMKRVTYNSPVILTYTLVALLALGLNALTGGWTNAHLFSVYRCSLLDPLA